MWPDRVAKNKWLLTGDKLRTERYQAIQSITWNIRGMRIGTHYCRMFYCIHSDLTKGSNFGTGFHCKVVFADLVLPQRNARSSPPLLYGQIGHNTYAFFSSPQTSKSLSIRSTVAKFPINLQGRLSAYIAFLPCYSWLAQWMPFQYKSWKIYNNNRLLPNLSSCRLNHLIYIPRSYHCSLSTGCRAHTERPVAPVPAGVKTFHLLLGM